MAVRVLVVDDSRFFRRRVEEILASDPLITVIDTAENGVEAIEKVARLKPDVVTMDIEMPVMDGITAVRRIMASHPTPILMFSSLTTEGAQATLDALDAGALDFLPKKFEDISKDRDEARKLLCDRVRQLGVRKQFGVLRRPVAAPTRTVNKSAFAPKNANARSLFTPKKVAPPAESKVSILKAGDLKRYSVLAIGTSTGGPIALQEVLCKLPRQFPIPIVIVQHMPATFTAAFASRLDRLCDIDVKEAQDGDQLRPGLALLAPGGFQMGIERFGMGGIIRITPPTPDQIYKPSVDVTFMSLAKIFPAKVLSIIMTGMGADGCEGVRSIKKGGGASWIQNEETCVVYGMPAAVATAGLADHVLPLSELGPQLAAGV